MRLSPAAFAKRALCRRAWLIAGLLATPVLIGMTPAPLSLVTPAAAQTPGQEPGKRRIKNAVTVTTTTVRLEPVRERIQSLGTGKAVRDIIVTTDVPGTIETIHFDPNDPVSEGAPLVTLVRKTEEIALRSARANYEQQRASLARFKQLAQQSSGYVSKVQLDESQAAFAVAGASLAAAQYEFDRRVIRAPFAGRVNLTDLSPGSYLAQGAPIVALTDASQLMVEFSIPENAVSAVRAGVPVRVVTPALRGRAFEGQIVAFDHSISAVARTIQVRAKIENPDLSLRAGMTFLVRLEPDSTPIPVVPAVSVGWSRQGAAVWKLDEQARPVRVPVIIRRRDGDEVWVESSLKAGEQVIVDGALKVREGTTIRVKPAAGMSER